MAIDRRRFLVHLARVGGLGVLAALVASAAARPAGDGCDARDRCQGCPLASGCERLQERPA
jgi:hypothetical protein